VTEMVENDRCEDADWRLGDRRVSCRPIAGDDRRSGEDPWVAQRRHEYDDAINAAKAALIRSGINSPDFATAAKATEQARQRLSELLSADESARG
jgi:hypothetical protein